MILNFDPSRPTRKLDKPLKFLGYWHAVGLDKEGLPAIPNDFLAHEFDRYEETCGPGVLPFPWDFVDKTWDEKERLAVMAYLKVGKTYESWRGNSWCRFKCDSRYLPGYRDLTDGTYVWPEGFTHYVEKHNVKPPVEFIQHVLKYT